MYIHATLMKDNRKISIKRNSIITYYEGKKGGCIIETSQHQDDFGIHVRESYNEIRDLLENYYPYEFPTRTLSS